MTGNQPYTFYKWILFKALKRLTLGSLTMVLPDGTEAKFGNREETKNSARVRIRNRNFFKKVVLSGDIGFGESYAEGDWETEDISKVISWFILNSENCPAVSGTKRKNPALNLLKYLNKLTHAFRANDIKGARKNILEHYDLGNDFYRAFLDPTMTYSCAYFQSPQQTLEEAQKAKYDLLCKKLLLNPNDHVLEIGSGWGGWSIHAAKNYGCKVTTITISKEQFKFASEQFKKQGLSERIDLRLLDYRLLKGKFDKIVSIEMIEAVGDRYLETYFKKCNELLKKNGLLALQMITCPDPRYETIKKNVDWIQKHIFPGSLLPSIGRVNKAINKTGDLFLHSLEDMGHFYTKTLSKWHESFDNNIQKVKELGMDEPFIRKWKYYFEYCKAAFQMRNITVVQAVYTRPNNSIL